MKEGDADETKIRLKLEKEFSKEVYGQAKNVRISNRGGTVAGCSLDKNGVQFFYNRLTSIKIVSYSINEENSNYKEYISISYQELVNIKTNNDNNDIRSYFSVKINGYYVKITYDALRVAIHQYESTYNNRILDLENDIIILHHLQPEPRSHSGAHHISILHRHDRAIPQSQGQDEQSRERSPVLWQGQRWTRCCLSRVCVTF